MRFFEVVVSGAALLSSAFALTIDTYPSGGVQAGQTYTITYSPKDQTPTTFVLRRGLSTNLDTVGEIGTATGGTFTWVVPKNLPDGTAYALQAKQGTVENYSGLFSLSGGSGSLSSALASASSALSSASAAASSARASASSVVASVSSRASSAAASASISPSVGSNSTIVSPTLTRSASTSASGTTRPSASTTGGSPPQSTGAASALDASPLALIFGAIAAIAYFH